MSMKHGGDTLTYGDIYAGPIIDFSSNVNPLGYPKGLEFEWMKGFEDLRAYPDIKYRALRKSVGDYLGADPEQIVVGNGSMELIDAMIARYSVVQFFQPSFGEYEARAKIRNKSIVSIAMEDANEVDFDVLGENIREESLFILGNPNNPTGYRMSKENLLKFYQMIREKNAVLVLDEAFFEFCEPDYDSIDLFSPYGFENVLVVRAATKFFGLPGVRLGYGCTSLDLAKKIREDLNPWSVNAFAEIAGRYIFKCQDFIDQSKAYIKEERDYLLGELRQFEDLEVYESKANFILIKLLKHKETQVLQFFLERGLLIRTCQSFAGLEDQHIRVAVRSHEDNEKLIEVFKELFKEDVDVYQGANED